MKVKAVVDRLEGDKAIVLLGGREKQLVVARDRLPPGAKEGQWLKVKIENGVLVAAELDEEETATAKRRIAAKLAALRRQDGH